MYANFKIVRDNLEQNVLELLLYGLIIISQKGLFADEKVITLVIYFSAVVSS